MLSSSMANLEFTGVFTEDLGALIPGAFHLEENAAFFKSDKGGKSVKISKADIKGIRWQKLGNRPGLRFGLKDGSAYRFGGFNETDREKITEFAKLNWSHKVEETGLVIKGWNYGNAEVEGKCVDYTWEGKSIFEIPCAYVSNCIANKNEAILEFHQNDKAQVSLMEMRFHMPVDFDDEDDADQVESFQKAVLKYAGLEVETEQPITLLTDILCTTPRGRYDIKVYPTSIALHGKTYDYKIPIKTISRLFLVPHRDGRHVYFVLSLNPPIRQGQTHYSYLIFEFVKDDNQELELALTDEQLEDTYGGQLTREMDGPLYENVSILFKVVCNLKITVPGRFIGNSGTPAIQCSHKQNPGLLYPMEKGFLFIHKPVLYIRFEEISSCHFARSDAGTATRTFDFEIDLKSGSSIMFNAMEKEENGKLFDYLNQKGVKIRNAHRIDNNADVGISDDDIDPYKSTVQLEGRQENNESDDDSTDEDYDLDKDIQKQKKEKDTSEGSGSEPDDEYDSGSEKENSSNGESESDEETVTKKRKTDIIKNEKKEKIDKKEKPVKEKNVKKAKKIKDPNEPKRATTAYFLWFTANRLSLKEDGDSAADVARKGGAKWKMMSSDEKKEWEEKAAEDKARYNEEMKEYKKNRGALTMPSSLKPSAGQTSNSTSKYKSKEHVSDTDDDEPMEKENNQIDTSITSGAASD